MGTLHRLLRAHPWMIIVVEHLRSEVTVRTGLGVAAAVCVAPILALLFEAYGIGDVFPREGMNTSQVLAAPRATLVASVAKGVFAGGLTWGMVAIDAAIAVAIIALDMLLRTRDATFRTPVLAVGLYLPLELSVPVFLGAW